MFESLHAALVRAEADGVSLGELALWAEAEGGLRTRAEVEHALRRALDVMRRAVERGEAGDLRSVSGLVGGDAARLRDARGPLAGTLFTDVLAGALAVQEVNAQVAKTASGERPTPPPVRRTTIRRPDMR